MRGAQPWKTNRARVLREQATSAEERIWCRLRGRRLNGFKFVRQFPTEPYFVDFVCREKRLIVEVDGGTHGEDHEIRADASRTADLERMGYRAHRVTNADIYENIEGVLELIAAILQERTD